MGTLFLWFYLTRKPESRVDFLMYVSNEAHVLISDTFVACVEFELRLYLTIKLLYVDDGHS